MTKTIHVVPQGKNWAVKRQGTDQSEVFSSRKNALAAARRLAKETAPSQIVAYTKDGRIASTEVHGLPKVQSPRIKGSIGTSNIERAVSEMVRSRLIST